MIRRLDLTEGQAYTMAIGLALAVVLAVSGIPAVLRTRTIPAAASGVPTPIAAGAVTVPGATASPAPVSGPTLGGPSVLAQLPGLVLPRGDGGVPAAPGSDALPEDAAPPPVAAVAPGTISLFSRVDRPGAPGGLAVARDGTVYVSTNNGTARGDRGPSHVFAHDAHGARTGDRTISGQPADHANGLTGVAVDPVTGHVAVLQPDGARVLDVDMASGTQAVLAEIPDIPACLVSLGARPCQSGAEDRKPFPIAAAYDGSGNLFFTDPAQDTVWRLRRGARSPDAWYQSMDFAAGDGPYGLALRPGAVEFTVGTSLEPSNLAGGGLYRVAFDADGNAAARTVVATFPRGDEPGPLALGSSGTAYVVLRGTGAIVAITPAGFEAWRIRPPGNGPIPLDSPSALALVPGRLLVANGSNDPARWAVLAVAVDDGPGQ